MDAGDVDMAVPEATETGSVLFDVGSRDWINGRAIELRVHDFYIAEARAGGLEEAGVHGQAGSLEMVQQKNSPMLEPWCTRKHRTAY
ncbi:hypothetical protein SAY87_027483 [Trapa incisa]|uniref:Uncharacterized protein n=1 Tax=Trapa incisa TaxID=236973 RepID=A0AAN7GW78_9MYRT|nr:hypothetical protein SAY87_027483 [Trapa incisa]